MNQAALLIIDVQKGLDDPTHGERNNPQAEANIGKLLAKWRGLGLPVIHVRHDSTQPNSPLRLGQGGNEIKEIASPIEGEPLFPKQVNSAFIGTGLEGYLRKHNLVDLVVVGLTTDHCVSTSVRMAANLGFNVSLVEDAVATHSRIGLDGKTISAQQMHDVSLASLNGEFCRVISAKKLLTTY